MSHIQGKLDYNQQMIEWFEICVNDSRNPEIIRYIRLIVERLKEEKVELLEQKIKLMESNNDSNSDTK